MKIRYYAAYIMSAVAIVTYMSHFWYDSPAWTVLWIISGACAIGAIYSGIITMAHEEDKIRRGMATAAAVIGGIVLLGLTLSAIFLFVPSI